MNYRRGKKVKQNKRIDEKQHQPEVVCFILFSEHGIHTCLIQSITSHDTLNHIYISHQEVHITDYGLKWIQFTSVSSAVAFCSVLFFLHLLSFHSFHSLFLAVILSPLPSSTLFGSSVNSHRAASNR